MRLRKYCRSKKIIALVLATVVAFTSVFIGRKYSNESTIQTQKIEMTNQREVVNVRRNANEIITVNGKTYRARKLQVKASAYTTAKDEGGAWAYNNEKLKVGEHIAVDFKVIPMNSLVYIPQLGKVYKAVDTGSAIKGNKIDILMSTKQQCKQWGVKDLEIYVLEQ